MAADAKPSSLTNFIETYTKFKNMKCTKILVLSFLCGLWISCEKDLPVFNRDHQIWDDLSLATSGKYHSKALKTTGALEVFWNGNQGNGEDAAEGKRAFADFNAFDQYSKGDQGRFTFSVRNNNNTIHRQIDAEVFDVLVNTEENKAWFLAEVINDTKACGQHGGPGSGGHDDGDVCDHDDDGGCEHDEGNVGEEDGHDGGCDGGDSDHGGGGMVSGQNCRIGQIIAVKVHDQTTPAANGDGITWKWFSPEGANTPNHTSNVDSWPHLCEKSILGGNIVVHK